MNVFSRGFRNAFRNSIRTVSIVTILGLSIGFSLTMLIAHQAVSTKINTVKASVGNTITITPAGYSGFSQANNSLTTNDLRKVDTVAHVTSVQEALTDHLFTTGSAQPSFGMKGGSNSEGTISLTSPVTLNASGGGGGFRYHVFVDGGGSLPADFSPPITILGTNTPSVIDGTTLTITSGKAIDGSSNNDIALISQSMATKNNLQVGSTFTAYNTALTVAGIFSTNNQALSNEVILPLATEQQISGQSGDITSAIVTVDSLDHLSAATTSIQNLLGSSADVTSSQTEANNTVAPLNSVNNITLYCVIGSAVAASGILLMTMVMIVRERKREIGVIKAIGGSNIRIMLQFMVESLTLTMLGAIIGLLIGFVAANPVTNTLVTNSENSSISSTMAMQGPGSGMRVEMGPGDGRFAGGAFRTSFTGRGGARAELRSIHTVVGWGILLDGFGGAILIAVIGSALAAGLIAKVRPSEVMRAD